MEAHAPGAAEPIGVCCSGGGIRSAAFNLGALQALQQREVLRKTRYLSAVSGGSYIAAALHMVALSGKGSGGGLDAAVFNPCTGMPFSAGHTGGALPAQSPLLPGSGRLGEDLRGSAPGGRAAR